MKTDKLLKEAISNLKPGRSVKISGTEKKYCIAERSPCGKIIRFVRISPEGFEVFATEKCYSSK